MNVLLFTVVLCFVYPAARYLLCLRRNVARAKKSGFPYVILPWSHTFMTWRVTHSFVAPVMRRLPGAAGRYFREHLELIEPDPMHKTRQKWFNKLGQVFLVVSPDLIGMQISNAEANHWITSRREQFPKFLGNYKALRVFGPNVAASEGAEWRQHRRLIAGSFNETNAALVFDESIKQSLSMLRRWTGERDGEVGVGGGDRVLTCIGDDVTKLMLHIIGYVGFGLQLLWPDERLPEDTDAKLAKYASLDTPAGYEMPFLDALHGVLDNILLVLLMPSWLSSVLPYKVTQFAGSAKRNYVKYLNEMLDERLQTIETEEEEGGTAKVEGMDAMGQLARTGGGPSGLSREGMISNSFLLQLAGHETTASTLHFTLIYLASYPKWQRAVQRELDELVGGSDPSTWEYGKVVNGMLGRTAGAAMYETLRLMPPGPSIPKTSAGDQPLVMDGRHYTVPDGAAVYVGALGAQTNPRYWRTGPSRERAGETDIDEFVPDRWLKTTEEGIEGGPEGKEQGEEDGFGDVAGPTTSEGLFRPVRGSYLPFSDGARSCIGRRFAQAEVMAALAVVFSKYSIELAVEDEGEERGGEREEEARYVKARREAERVIRSSRMKTTLKLPNGAYVAMRVVRRGEERYVSWMD